MSDPMLPEGLGVDGISLFQPAVHPLRDSNQQRRKDPMATESGSAELQSPAAPDVLQDDRWQPNSTTTMLRIMLRDGCNVVAERDRGDIEPEASAGEATSSSEQILNAYFRRLEKRPAWRWHGRVIEATGQTIESEGPFCSVGECCEILDREGNSHPGEVIGFRGPHVLSMTLDSSDGIRFGDSVAALGDTPSIDVGDDLLGRVLNAQGYSLDGGPRLRVKESWPLERAIPQPMDRVPIQTRLGTGLRAIDGLLTVGRGQRVGIFGGSGVGKSTLIGMMTRNTAADLTVVGSGRGAGQGSSRVS